jgi:hypothetical protein
MTLLDLEADDFGKFTLCVSIFRSAKHFEKTGIKYCWCNCREFMRVNVGNEFGKSQGIADSNVLGLR